jgi:hypothetical protein
MVEYLKAENRILRSKLPQQIETTPAERAELLKVGVRLGPTLSYHRRRRCMSLVWKTCSAESRWAAC